MKIILGRLGDETFWGRRKNEDELLAHAQWVHDEVSKVTEIDGEGYLWVAKGWVKI